MPPIDQRLLERLEQKLGIGRSAVYARIQAKASQTLLPRELAAIALAAELGIGVSRYATAEQLAQMRGQASGNQTAAAVIPQMPSGRGRSKKKKPRSSGTTRAKHDVFVVHGRNERVRKDMFSFLRAIGLRPLEWSNAMAATKTGSPYVGDVLDKAFSKAQAVVVLLTGDDEARLRQELVKRTDPKWEAELTPQARPNVLFEAGMAFGHLAKSTVLVQVGSIRSFSDVAGRHIVKLDNSAAKRTELAGKLKTCGCPVDTSGTDWLDVGNFEQDS